MIQAIIVIISILIGWTLRGYRIDKAREIRKQIEKKLRPNKSSAVEWTPPKGENKLAEEKVKENLNVQTNIPKQIQKSNC